MGNASALEVQKGIGEKILREIQNHTIRTVIVDDDQTIGDVLKDLISREHISVKVFNDSLEAVKSITKEPVDVVITDLMMPRISGLEVLRQAKVMNPDVVVIIITGHGSLETAIEAIRQGAYDYIKKPFKLQEMAIVFKNAVEKVDLTREKAQLLIQLKEAYDQLVAIKKERDGGHHVHKAQKNRIARLNFFSSDQPVLHLMRSAPTGEPNYFEQLQNISMLKRDGLLTESEFKTLKAHLMKGLKSHE